MAMLIGIAGKKEAGKSSAAYCLEGSGFVRMSFADTLKLITRIVFRAVGYNEEQIQFAFTHKEQVMLKLGVSARHFMQTLGTNWGRVCINNDLWVMITDNLLPDAHVDNVVFDDVRFENEAALIRRKGGVVVHISRPGNVNVDHHASENGVVIRAGDCVIINDGDEDALYDKVHALLVQIRFPAVD